MESLLKFNQDEDKILPAGPEQKNRSSPQARTAGDAPIVSLQARTAGDAPMPEDYPQTVTPAPTPPKKTTFVGKVQHLKNRIRKKKISK